MPFISLTELLHKFANLHKESCCVMNPFQRVKDDKNWGEKRGTKYKESNMAKYFTSSVQ